MRNHKSSRVRTLPLIIAGTLVGFTACGSSHHGHHDFHDPHPGPVIYFEAEPNDTPYNPVFIDTIHSDTHLIVEGYVEAGAFGDLYDHYEFVAAEPVEIEFFLQGLDPFSDMDLYVWDPEFEEVVLAYESGGTLEAGSFFVDEPGKVFQLVVTAYTVSSDYDLELIGYPNDHVFVNSFLDPSSALRAGDGTPSEGPDSPGLEAYGAHLDASTGETPDPSQNTVQVFGRP